MRIGEPKVTVTACSDQTIRVRLTSPFDDLLDQTYGWPLSPPDDSLMKLQAAYRV